MQRSSKLGLTSLVLVLLCAATLPIEFPFSTIFGFLSCVMGLLAGFQGSRWWLAIPGTILTMTLFVFLVTAHIP
jgi:hypothetical protein